MKQSKKGFYPIKNDLILSTYIIKISLLRSSYQKHKVNLPIRPN